MTEINSRNIKVFMLILLFFMLVSNIIYANFSNAVEGTADINGKFDMQFSNSKIIRKIGVEDNTTKIEISHDYDTLVVDAGNLKYPGARVEFCVDIINMGTVTSKIESIKSTGLDSGKAIKVIGLDNIINDASSLKPGEKYTLDFYIEWDKNYDEGINEEISFEFKINYVQDI